jgi:hypothetical protein
MKAAGIVVPLALILALPLRGQVNEPKAEIFAGYSFSHTSFDIGHNLNGWGASVSATVTRYVGLTGDFSGNYSSQTYELPCPSPGCPPQTVTVSAYHFLGGPRFTRRTRDATLFAHALLGIVNRGGAPDKSTGFALGFGGGVDVPVRQHLAVRVFQVDYIPFKRPSDFGGGWDNEFRVQAGIVFTIGKK